MPGKGRKNKALTLKQKLAIIIQIDEKQLSRQEIANKFNCDISTIHRISRNRQILEEAATKNNIKRKRLREGRGEKVEEALSKWFDQMRSSNAVISGAQLKEKAAEFALKIGCNFKPTSGWMWRWQRRENIKFKKIQGEAADADTVEADIYRTVKLKNLLKDYVERDIFNADESGLFYKALPNGTLNRVGCNAVGGKTQKARLTLLFLCNAGKSKNPRCFKGKIVPVPYYSQNKSWMTSALWSIILKEFDREMEKQKRKVLLIVDNAACHKLDHSLANVKVEFLPPNTTSTLQPLDQGIINSFKVYCRQIMIRKQLLAVEKGLEVRQFVKSITLLDTLTFVKRSWELVSSETIKNCFQKAGFQVGDVLSEDIEEMVVIPIEQTEFEEYVACDKNIDCMVL